MKLFYSATVYIQISVGVKDKVVGEVSVRIGVRN